MRITAMENGPNKLELDGATAWSFRNGEEEITVIERATIFLCRCGHSANKPFCDGTHRTIGFEAPGSEVEVVLAAQP